MAQLHFIDNCRKYANKLISCFRKRNEKKAKHHFIDDYRKHVRDLIKTCPTIDEAMSQAVGGGFTEVGNIERDILLHFGLKPDMTILDYGCGSGRLAVALSNYPNYADIKYIGVDVVDELLEYASSKTPQHYKYIKHYDLSVPLDQESVDIVCAFSLFTHLLHSETFIYMEDMARVLKKPGGMLILSFLEFALPSHWSVFERTVNAQKQNKTTHLNTFIERHVIQLWADKLGFKDVEFVSGTEAIFNGKSLWQSIAILKGRKFTKQ